MFYLLYSCTSTYVTAGYVCHAAGMALKSLNKLLVPELHAIHPNFNLCLNHPYGFYCSSKSYPYLYMHKIALYDIFPQF
jgi:hypothetical protein